MPVVSLNSRAAPRAEAPHRRVAPRPWVFIIDRPKTCLLVTILAVLASVAVGSVRIFLLLITLLVATSAYPATPSPQEKELYAGLLSWAVMLSGYPRPATTPTVEFVPQEFFNEN